MSDDGETKEVDRYRIRFACQRAYGSLDVVTGETGRRHCGQCDRQVHWCSTRQELRTHVRAGHCVAVAHDLLNDALVQLAETESPEGPQECRVMKSDLPTVAWDVIEDSFERELHELQPLVGSELVEKYGPVPFTRIRSTMLLAFDRDVDRRVLDEYKFRTAYEMEVVLATPETLAKARARYLKREPQFELGVLAEYD